MANLVDLHSYLEQVHDKFNVIYDIGASDGKSSDAINLPLTNNPAFYLFDADGKYADRQHNYRHEYHAVLLSDIEKEVNFYSNGTSGDSYYLEVTGAYGNVTPEKRKTVTLDSYVADKGIPLPDLIKIDTQGSELDILKGATNCLNNAVMVIMECPILEYNQGAPKFEEYISFMVNNGFLPQNAVELHWMNGVMVQMDIAFVRVRR